MGSQPDSYSSRLASSPGRRPFSIAMAVESRQVGVVDLLDPIEQRLKLRLEVLPALVGAVEDLGCRAPETAP